MVKITPKTKAWQAYARYCKVKGCLETTGFAFLGVCITCKRRFHMESLDAGHAISGRRNAVLFNTQIIYPQCDFCNRQQNGRIKLYQKILAEMHGQEWMDQQKIRAKRNIKDINIDFVKMEHGFNKAYKRMMEQHGFHTWGQLLQMGR